MKPGFAIQTLAGHAFDPKNVSIDKISINDIAHALSNLCRYAGHCRKFYCVAEHSVLTYRIAKELWPDDLEAQWAALLHDATEAYVGDVPSPLKVLLPNYVEIEDSLARKIARVFKIRNTKDIRAKVKRVDMAALATEAPNLFEDVSHWTQIQELETFDHLFASRSFCGIWKPLGPGASLKLFMDTYNTLKARRDNERERAEICTN